jgi:DNA-binding MarR family transcriptional regulator
MKKYYYLRFRPTANIDYLYLLAFYDLAEYNEETKVFDTIHYSSVRVLAESLNISPATVNRIFDSPAYAEFISVDKSTKTITLCNAFNKGQKEQFVRLTAEEVNLIKEVKDNLFAKYLIYLKYYCGYARDKKTDFTAQQFLSACGYSVKSNKTISQISQYNCLLVDRGIIKIQKTRDELGHTRNIYSYI